MTCSYVELQPLLLRPRDPDLDPSVQLCELIAITVAAAFAVPLAELRASTRRPRAVAFARQSAMYLAHVVCGLTLTEVGRGFGRNRTTAAYACELVEERRDDPAIDAMLESLEYACGSLGRCLDPQEVLA
jgi:chromosomal replication initiation ATPase DnaA